jgi:amino acid adenylation domain-containing protein
MSGEPQSAEKVVSETHQALSITERFERQVRDTPDAVAVACGVARLTYRELDAKANQLARHLRVCGVEREALVGLLHERSVDLVVGVLGILKAGGAYVPMDPANPEERIAAVLADAGVRAVVTQSDLARMVPGHVEHVVRLDADAAALEGLSPEAPGVQTGGADAAYVIYTSGSTGKPKGVIVTHHNVVRLFDATAGWYSFGPTDVWTLFHSIAFDFSVWELWGALLYGGRLVVVPQEISRSPEQFLDLLTAERVTVLNQTPSAFRMLTQADAARPAPALLVLRYVVFGGEALDLGSLRPWVVRYGDETPQLINMYGITETTVHVTYRRILRGDLDRGLGSVIGEPIPDLQFYLLDEAGQPVPPGVAGEIFVGGAGVARGYLNRPELTAERFLADRFAGTPGARMYRSGDQARRLPDGEVEYLGRLDTQVKIRGHRIELREIEVVLRDHEGVGDAIVVMREDTPGDSRLVAYYTNGSGAAEPTAAMLRGYLGQRLPEYMVPSYFVVLERIPLTPNGKADRRALPAPGRRRPELGHALVAPRTPVERWVAGHWRELLNIDEIGVHDRFFELGGTSITAMRLLARLSQDTGSRLPAVLLFRGPTVSEMARLLEQDHRDVLPEELRGARPGVGTLAQAGLPSAAERAAKRRDALRERRLQRRPGG